MAEGMRAVSSIALACLASTLACVNATEGRGVAAAQDEEEEPLTMKIESSAFAHEGSIPKKYTCQGPDVSPPLSWSGAPEGTRSFVLIVDDPDAPDPAAPKMTWVHWVLYDLPSDVTSLPEAIDVIPAGARHGKNGWNRTGYGGPCPPVGRHRYFHKVYALDTLLGDLEHPSKDEVVRAMEGHVLASAELVGTYEKE